MSTVIVSLFEGLALGAMYALVGLGLILAFRATGVLSFAQGQLMLLGVFLIGNWQAKGWGDFPLQFFLALVIVAGISMAFYWFVLRPVDGLPHFIGFVATLGLASILDAVITIFFGAAQYSVQVPGLPTGVVEILGARVSLASIVVTVVSIAVAIAAAMLLQGTEFGIRMRAAGRSPVLASQSGIRIRLVFLFAWGLTGVFAVLAGIAFASTRLATASLVDLMLAAFPAIFLGGLDSIWGALVGGLGVGLLQGITLATIGSEYVQLVTWVALLVIMLILPQGIFGTRDTVRV